MFTSEQILTGIALIFLMTLIGDEAVQKFVIPLRPKLEIPWLVFRRTIIGLVFWLIISALSIAVMGDLFFPRQSTHIRDLSPLTITNLVLWALIVGYISTGRPAKTGDENQTGTADARFGRVIEFPFKVLGKIADFVWALVSPLGPVLRIVMVGIAWLFGLALTYVFLSMGVERLNNMPTSTAIVIGAIIISFALLSTQKK